jgi:hypothetical protein
VLFGIQVHTPCKPLTHTLQKLLFDMMRAYTQRALFFLFLGITKHNASAFQMPTTSSPSVRYHLSDSKLFSMNESEEYNTSFESAVRNGWTPARGTFAGIRRVSAQTKMNMSDGAVMPDGGLSPCIIKVVGVGGGGCNAVSIVLIMI